MPTFGYKALNESGNKVTGEVEAATVEEATNILVARGLIPEKIGDRTAGMKSGMAFFSGRVKVADLILFTKQFRSMLSAGVAILRLLQVLETQTQSRVLKDTIGKIVVDIRGGATLSEALQKFPRIFSPLYCAMIRAGELSGNLP
ncbi:MAG: type II secretion system F family protein, partial [Smithellaceae bacterium]|nr:type II secretion system F family protein [Smithellaceae bacterium]